MAQLGVSTLSNLDKNAEAAADKLLEELEPIVAEITQLLENCENTQDQENEFNDRVQALTDLPGFYTSETFPKFLNFLIKTQRFYDLAFHLDDYLAGLKPTQDLKELYDMRSKLPSIQKKHGTAACHEKIEEYFRKHDLPDIYPQKESKAQPTGPSNPPFTSEQRDAVDKHLPYTRIERFLFHFFVRFGYTLESRNIFSELRSRFDSRFDSIAKPYQDEFLNPRRRIFSEKCVIDALVDALEDLKKNKIKKSIGTIRVFFIVFEKLKFFKNERIMTLVKEYMETFFACVHKPTTQFKFISICPSSLDALLNALIKPDQVQPEDKTPAISPGNPKNRR